MITLCQENLHRIRVVEVEIEWPPVSKKKESWSAIIGAVKRQGHKVVEPLERRQITYHHTSLQYMFKAWLTLQEKEEYNIPSRIKQQSRASWEYVQGYTFLAHKAMHVDYPIYRCGTMLSTYS